MNIFRTTIAAGLIFFAIAPAHGMWKAIKDTIAPQQGLTIDTQRVIAATAAVMLLETAIATPVIDWSDIIAKSAHPILVRAMLLSNAVGIPALFVSTLQNNPDFWNREGAANRLFLFLNSVLSFSAIRTGLTAANIMQ